MARPEKVAAVDEISEKLSSSGATVITEYRGLTVTELAQLRATLRESGTTYKVFKNTLARRAVEAAELGELSDLLVGPTAWAFVEGDVVAAAKALKEFSKGNDALVIKGGLLEGQIITPDQVSDIAELPSREQLLAKLAGAFKAPMAKAAGLFSAIPRNTAYGIKALIDKRIAAGEEAPPAEDSTDADADSTEAPAPAAEDSEATDAPAPAAEGSEGSEETSAASSEDSGAESGADEGAAASEDGEGDSSDAKASDETAGDAEASADDESPAEASEPEPEAASGDDAEEAETDEA